MLSGRSVIRSILLAFLAACTFILAEWLIPLLFGAIGIAIPDQIVTILSLLITVGFLYGSYGWGNGPVV